MDYILAILSFIEIKLKFGTWRQNRDFFGTFFALWSHLGPSPEFGTLSERLDHHVVAKYNPSHGVNFWARCASGNV